MFGMEGDNPFYSIRRKAIRRRPFQGEYMGRGLKILLFALVTLILAGGLSMWLLPGAMSAKGKPSELEIRVARFVRYLATPQRFLHASNPVPATPEILREARRHFADHCATCHGNDGSGKTHMGPNFYPPVPDLRSSSIQAISDGELFYIIHDGIRFTGMPAWGTGDPAQDQDGWKLVHFIRHLPLITPEEIADMKQYNPLTKQERIEQEMVGQFLSGEDVPLPTEHHH